MKDHSLAPFYYGVASGNPTSSSIVLWAKVDIEARTKAKIKWELCADSICQQVLRRGNKRAFSKDNFTLHIKLDGLKPDTYYYYRFKKGTKYSIIGRTRTANESGYENVKLAVASCSNYEFGYFSAYRHIALIEDLDAVIHLGDYIYELAPDQYGDPSFHRKHLPPRELVSLEEYRLRYAQYRLDPDLRLLHQMHPFIIVYDDHEIANNAYKEGAQNHESEVDGDYTQRKHAAVKAWHEWMPVDKGPYYPSVRNSFRFGDMVELILPDLRLEGRDKQAESYIAQSFKDTSRTMLGTAKRKWMKDKIAGCDAEWLLIASSVTFGNIDFGGLTDDPAWRYNLDSWARYPNEYEWMAKILSK